MIEIISSAFGAFAVIAAAWISTRRPSSVPVPPADASQSRPIGDRRTAERRIGHRRVADAATTGYTGVERRLADRRG